MPSQHSAVDMPAARSRSAYRSPSSRSGLYSAVITRAGGRPARSGARSGAARGLAAPRGSFR
jgi:hypothetical protein